MAKRRFDFIIGAIHFLPGGRDIYRLPYRSEEEIHGMFLRYFASVEALVELGGFDSLAHLDYPLRVLRGKVPGLPASPVIAIWSIPSLKSWHGGRSRWRSIPAVHMTGSTVWGRRSGFWPDTGTWADGMSPLEATPTRHPESARL